jgi:cell division septal protein FtsQ
MDEKHLAKIRYYYKIICIFAVIKWFLVAAGVLLMCISVYMLAFKRKNCRNVVFYDNKAYTPKHRDINDALCISTLSDITRTHDADIRKRWGNFPDKSSSRSEPNKTSDNVGLGVFKEPNTTASLSNVFM